MSHLKRVKQRNRDWGFGNLSNPYSVEKPLCQASFTCVTELIADNRLPSASLTCKRHWRASVASVADVQASLRCKRRTLTCKRRWRASVANVQASLTCKRRRSASVADVQASLMQVHIHVLMYCKHTWQTIITADGLWTWEPGFRLSHAFVDLLLRLQLQN